MMQRHKLEELIYGKIVSFASKDNLERTSIRILLALSGGMDSMVLFDVILNLSKKYQFEIGIAHVNHGIHKNANKSEEFCRTFAEKNNCNYYSTKLNPPGKNQSIEEWARNKRYLFLKKIAKDNQYHWIFTAHHEDDQIETIFMRKIQKHKHWISLIGIREEMENIRRPMLNVSKQDILQYAHYNSIRWIEDPTNIDQVYFRNKIRHNLLPKEIQNNPDLRTQLLRLSKTASIKFEELKKVTLEAEKSALFEIGKNRDYYSIDKDDFCKYKSDVKKLLIQSLSKRTFSKLQLELSNDNWNTFFQFIEKSTTGKIFKLTNDISCLLDRSLMVIFVNNSKKLSKLNLMSEETHNWGNNRFSVKSIHNFVKSDDKYLMIAPSQMKLYVRIWEDGDFIISYNSRKKVKLSDLFINNKLSRLEKQKYPVIVDDSDTVCWVPGILHGVVDGISKSKQLKEIRWEEH
ncbi:MAG: tRNA lysidine(34) synthetase TilS [Candidatus Marinimicrobia bacterium]|nr:tRNA lysidine(34) synthetase TilS [Candidatus Neomarinimicrobiota bacterium]MBL7022735.1 tRNA lysidine(34) synthetase TilS [Candidatus Neomarinimicrobiota bacterium]MBL7109136.1 tRNA lysidine(34) synthetase TilS [Candidatus Neomarinimicrobiota bacterium]